MSFYQKLQIVTALAVIVGLSVTARGGSRPSMGALAIALATLTCSLLAVGVVSHTLMRHVVQVIPVVVAFALVIRRSAIGVPAAAPIFAFWLLIMGGIWLFLVGAAPVFPGRFSPTEIALTVVIGAASLIGLVITRQSGRTTPAVWVRIMLVVAFAILQWAAMWTSVQVSRILR